MRSFQMRIAEALGAALGVDATPLVSHFSTPPDANLGDLAFPCFLLAKELKKGPPQIAAEIAGLDLGLPWVTAATATGPYVNFKFDRAAFAEAALAELNSVGDRCGVSDAGAGKTIVIDYSSPNIAKHLAVHHLRSTMLGQAMANIFRAAGYTVVGVNHLGDWGTGFGKLLCALEHFGSEEGLGDKTLSDCDDPIATLNALYTRFHAELEARPELEEEARGWFRRLEEGDETARVRWQEIRDLSLARFQRVYDRLGVAFDEVIGESFFEDRMPGVIAELEEKGLLEESDDAQVVSVGDDIPPFLVRKNDGTTLYGTRDLAAVQQRDEAWKFDRCLYVVDAGQGLHFRQLFTVAEKLGWPCAERLEHTAFGVMRMPVDGGWAKGKTREGRVVLLEEVLDFAAKRALQVMNELAEERGQELTLEDPEAVAEAVGLGAVIFSDMKARRIKDVNFDLEQIVNFQGETGPYLQYTHARLCGIYNRRAEIDEGAALGRHLTTDEDLVLLRELLSFSDVVAKSADEAEPSVVSQALLSFAASFNRYYNVHKVIAPETPERSRDRLALVDRLRVALGNGLRMLGITPLEKM